MSECLTISYYPKTGIVLRIFLSLHVTVVTRERSFRKLKRKQESTKIKMRQQRLNGLAILSPGYQFANTQYLTAKFGAAKVRKVRC